MDKVNFLKHPNELKKAHLENCDGIVVRLGVTLNKNLLKRFDSLKFIATITTGLDHVDLEYCNKNKIEVISLKGEYLFLSSVKATPEYTWGLMLSLIRSIPQACISVKNNNWNRDLFWGEELYKKNTKHWKSSGSSSRKIIRQKRTIGSSL